MKQGFLHSPEKTKKKSQYFSDIEIVDITDINQPESAKIKTESKENMTLEQIISSKKGTKIIQNNEQSKFVPNSHNPSPMLPTKNLLIENMANRNFDKKPNQLVMFDDDSKKNATPIKEQTFTSYAKNFMKEEHHEQPIASNSGYIVSKNNIIIENQQNYNINNNFVVINTPVDVNNPNLMQDVIKMGSYQNKGQRYDRRGVAIEKGKKNHKVTYIDRVDKSMNFANVVYIESYKKYMEVYEENPGKAHETESSSCCAIL